MNLCILLPVNNFEISQPTFENDFVQIIRRIKREKKSKKQKIRNIFNPNRRTKTWKL